VVNQLRQDPSSYLTDIDNFEQAGDWGEMEREYFFLNGDLLSKSDVQEIRVELANLEGKPAMNWNESLATAAAAHCEDLGPDGIYNHEGISSDGSNFIDTLPSYGLDSS
jgi:uncharacterized protein YkwD